MAKAGFARITGVRHSNSDTPQDRSAQERVWCVGLPEDLQLVLLGAYLGAVFSWGVISLPWFYRLPYFG
jgi:hypothetical protein